ncbi:MAG: hypothetical protein ACOH2D_12680 [Gelidibacter sp.]
MLLALVVLSIVGYFVADAIIASKLDKFLKTKLPETIGMEYESIDINIWRGSAVMVRPKIVSKGGDTSKVSAEIELDAIIVDGFGYWNYFVNDNIHVESVQLRSPKLRYNHDKTIPENDRNNSSLNQLKQEIKVDRFNIQNGELTIRDRVTDSIVLHSEGVAANVMSILLDAASVKKPFPFSFEDYNLSFNDFFYSMGTYENLTISDAQIDHKKALFHQLKIFTKYSKTKLNQIISTERDHFDITMPSLVFEYQKFGYEQDSVFYFKSPKVIFEDAEMYIYRNKLIADDTTRKELYSKMLRDLKFDLTLSEVELKNATIVYSEKVNTDMQAGKISFTKLNAHLKNISNTYAAGENTTLDIDAIFMAKTPIKVHWEFDVNDVNDAFVFKADIGKLPAPDLNPFSQPNLKVLLEGELFHTYATISGNKNTSRVNMKAKYEDFKVDILDKEGEKKNKVLSAIANLFIKKSSDQADLGFRESFKDDIERDKTKSIFNFLWLNLKAGLVSIMTGNGNQ